MTTKYDILKHQVAPILQDAGNDTNALALAGKHVSSQLDQVMGACTLPMFSGAVRGYQASVVAELQEALALAARVISAATTATRDYVLADYHMTDHAHQALRAGIPTPQEIKLEHQR